MRNIHDDEYDEFWENYTEPTKAEKIKTAREVREFIVGRKWNSLRIHGKYSKENKKNSYGNYGCSGQYTEYIYDNNDGSYIIRYGTIYPDTNHCCPICGSSQHSRKDCPQGNPRHIPWNVLDTEITNFCKAEYVEVEDLIPSDSPSNWFELLGYPGVHRMEPNITVLLDREIIPKIPVSWIARTEDFMFNFSKFVVNNDLYITKNKRRKLIFDKVKLERYDLNYRNETYEQNNKDHAVRKFLEQLDIWCDWYDPKKGNYSYC